MQLKMAPKRTKKAVKVVRNTDYKNLSLHNVSCPICRSILLEPVSLPCSHAFCLSCFQSTMANTNLVCPLCRKRIGSWLRNAEKHKKLVNLEFWEAIKTTFPDKVKNKTDGIDDTFEDEVHVKLATPGEIRREYELQRRKEELEEKKRRESEIKASEELIRKITDEEEYRRLVEEEKLQLDRKVAKELAKSFESVPGPSNAAKRGPMDRFLKANDSKEFSVHILSNKGKKNLQIRRIVSDASDSNDSIELECHYFKPIDHKNIPQNKPACPIKIPPKVVVKQAMISRAAPNGTVKFEHSESNSPFIPIINSKSPTLSSYSQLKEGPSDSFVKGVNGRVESRKRIKGVSSDIKKVPVKKARKIVGRSESPPFLGFDAQDMRVGVVNGEVKTTVEFVCDKDAKKLKQEQEDFEFAKKLQEEINRSTINRYSTRVRITRNNKKQSRQITLEEIMKPSLPVNI